jgi:hypothetical protein
MCARLYLSLSLSLHVRACAFLPLRLRTWALRACLHVFAWIGFFLHMYICVRFMDIRADVFLCVYVCVCAVLWKICVRVLSPPCSLALHALSSSTISLSMRLLPSFYIARSDSRQRTAKQTCIATRTRGTAQPRAQPSQPPQDGGTAFLLTGSVQRGRYRSALRSPYAMGRRFSVRLSPVWCILLPFHCALLDQQCRAMASSLMRTQDDLEQERSALRAMHTSSHDRISELESRIHELMSESRSPSPCDEVCASVRLFSRWTKA